MTTEPTQTATQFALDRDRLTDAAPPLQSESLPTVPSRQHHWISSLLKPAIKLFLKSQLEAVETLTVDIEAGDRQLLSGCIPQVSLSAQQAIYQGLHLSQITVEGRDIQINIGQVMRGKPLRLLHPVPLAVNLQLLERDLNRSLEAPLLAGAVADLLDQWLRAAQVVGLKGHLDTRQSPQIVLANDSPGQARRECLTLTAPWVDEAGALGTLILRSELQLAGHHCLQFQRPELIYQRSTPDNPEDASPMSEPQVEVLADFALDLGTDVELTVLQIQPGALHCQGYIWVNP